MAESEEFEAPEAMWTHTMIHRESLATKELCPELSEVVGAVIKTVNYTKTRPLKRDLLQNYARKWGHSISQSCFTVILVGRPEGTFWLVFTTCEKK
jgi:hypothetical protein